MASIDQRVEKWKKRLLDLGKRNRLINFRETKRSNIKILFPGFDELYSRLVVKEEALTFPYFSEEDAQDGKERLVSSKPNGDLRTDRTLADQQKTLASLRSNAKTAVEEQGVNILYLSFGLLHWKEYEDSEDTIASPIVLVPAALTIESITSPYKLSLHEDEIVINPTLSYKLENDFGIQLPSFDDYENDIRGYLTSVNRVVSQQGWWVTNEAWLSLLSFLKINMYQDLDRNRELLTAHAIVKALSGDRSEITDPPEALQNFDHDTNIKPVETFQVVDADSSQQDAILYSKKGVSFVLQGPPGTGKSQTITNIIAEALADGKKVLFVSEKMAALQVVHKRLAQAGLADFCLALHSHKANKKQVLDDLGRTLNLNRIKVQSEAMYQLETLKKDRDKLNQYTVELHTPCLPLGETIYEINGRLAKHHGMPDVIFAIKDIREITPETLNLYQYVLQELSSTIGKMHEDYTVNPWRGSCVPAVTHQLRHDIETHLRLLVPLFTTLVGETDKTIDSLALERTVSLRSIDDLLEILDIASCSPKIPIDWIDSEDIAALAEQAENYRNLQAEYKSLVSALSQHYAEGFFHLPAVEISRRFNEAMLTARKNLSTTTYPDEVSLINAVQNIILILKKSLEGIQTIQSVCEKAKTLLGIKAIETMGDTSAVTNLMANILADPHPIAEWFIPERFKVVKRLFADARKNHEELSAETKSLTARFDSETLNLDYSAMLKRFKTEYTSIFKIFKKRYRADKKVIQALSNEAGKKLNDDAVIGILNEIKSIDEKRKWIAENRDAMTALFGNNFAGEYTDWQSFESTLATFEKIVGYFGPNGVSQNVKDMLLTGGQGREVVDGLYRQIQPVWSAGLAEDLNATLEIHRDLESVVLLTLQKGVKALLATLEALSSEYEQMQMYRREKAGYEEVVENLLQLVRVQEISAEIKDRSERLKAEYQFLFTGIETDWNTILNALSWTGTFKKVIQKSALPRSFVERICGDENAIRLAGERLAAVRQAYAAIQVEWAWFIALFDEQDSLLDAELHILLERMEQCLNKLSALEEWIDYRSSREQCREAGLGEYMEKVEELRIDKDLIIPAFLKRLYRLWLDAVLPEFPAVFSFRRRTQEAVVKDFVNLDVSQLRIARVRVRERLISQLPDVNKFTSSVDEVSVLKRELNKQRRIMPLRKLFKEIPNLLLTLKPCLMMSPLSVSLFLDAEKYKFDIVIFDEASQVRTEDAVGAIMRGVQLVIAGDSEQLPPTNFFTASTGDSDYDTDDEEDYDDTDGYESVLDEAVTVLPERTLRWHYRSRHEHLIAFSNAKIYNHKLITFPSYIEKAPDHGVEYIPVPNGVYDRNGKRDNVNEARRVAEIVFEQIRKYPKRSLGVVTFSEAQQQAVEAAIRQIRLRDKRYETFFTEDKEEAFFVKNLENVQGDERDTIIFSIGYARDQNGVMHMNFGPLSRTGGYRRLNVAITRAKFNVKLVGSISPGDIDLEKTNADGVKMLRSYIEFAQHGPQVFQRETMASDVVGTESPFEEAVYDFLTQNGCNVATQVGCSGYRIDMAIKHPRISGRFVLGIECDGASYHSARTVRERDRLRQTVLEDIGWKIYRIWSTDWIKDPVTEGLKLLDAVRNAVEGYSEDSPHTGGNGHGSTGSLREAEVFSVEVPVAAQVESMADNSNPYDFVVYEEADISKIEQHPVTYQYYANIIRYVVQKEYPVHIEVLCKRLVTVMGSQKVTSNVREYILSIIKRYLVSEVELRNEFLWPKGARSLSVKVPAANGSSRKIDHISTEELSEAMWWIASKSFGIMQKDLYLATARAFGFNRTGGNIAIALNLAYEHLLSTGRAKNSDGKIICVRNPL